MGKRIGGSRRKMRYLLTKDARSRGKISIRSYLQTFTAGEKVLLKTEPAYQKGQYFKRFHGKEATIVSQRGFCYLVKLKDKDKTKQVYVHPVHLRKVNHGRS
jgi:ribosomal protein L21E